MATNKPLTKKDVEKLQATIDRVESKVDNALTDLRKLESYLYDDDHTDTPGLVKQVRKNTEDIAEIKEAKKVDKKVTAGLGIGGGGAVVGIYELVKWIIVHLNK